MPSSPKFLISAWIAAGLLAACTFSRRNTGIPAPTSDSSPTETAATNLPAEENAEYLRTLTDLGFGKYLAASDERRTRTVEGVWDVYHYDLSDCRCLLGSDYFVMARKGTESAKTVFWLEGGGACFPGRDDCTKDAARGLLGLQSGLASASGSNPVRDWNYIYVPYCDGSIHLGDSDADYDGDGAPDHWHWGLKNTSAAVRLTKELFPETQEILVAGCSAGGYGTLGTTPIVRLEFPQADLYVLNESGLGLMNPEIYDTYNAAYRIWNLTPLFPPDCPLCGKQFIYMYPWMLARDPRLRVGVFSSYRDAMFTANWEMDPEDYEALLLATSADARKDYPDRFHRYFVEGGGHCVSDYSHEVNGVSIWEWIGYMLADDPRWNEELE
jgi:hypothetical protein